MSEENKALVRRQEEELSSDGNLDVTDEIYAPDQVGHDPSNPEDVRGLEAAKQAVSEYRQAFPDLRVSVEDLIAEGDRVAARRGVAGRRGSRIARRGRIELTEEWIELELLLEWSEQVEYERIHPAVGFGSPVAERSRQTDTPQSTLRRRITGLGNKGMCALFESERVAGKSALDPKVQGLILNLKADYPPMSDNEIANICYVRFGKRPHGRSVQDYASDFAEKPFYKIRQVDVLGGRYRKDGVEALASEDSLRVDMSLTLK